MKRGRVVEFDMVRGIGALAVVAIHVTAVYGMLPAGSARYLLLGAVNNACAFAVPLFLFLSAAQLTYGVMHKSRFSPSAFYSKRFGKTVPVYLLWVAIYYLYLKVCGYYRISPIREPGKFFAEYVLQGKVFYHLYFMPLIFQLYLLFPAMLYGAKRIVQKPKNVAAGFLILFAVLSVLQGLYHELYWEKIYFYFNNSAILIFAYMLPIGMGIWVGANYETFRQSKPIMLAALAGAVVLGYLYIRTALYPAFYIHGVVRMLYATCACVVVLSLTIVISHRDNLLGRILREIGRHSFTIYLLHPLILDQLDLRIPDAVLRNGTAGEIIMYVLVRYVLAFGGAYVITVLLDAAKKRVQLLRGV